MAKTKELTKKASKSGSRKTSKTGSQKTKGQQPEEKTYTPPKVGKPRSYTPEQFEKAVRRYFKKITRIKRITELVPSGNFDDYGHPIMVPEPVKNCDGEYVERIEYLVTPCVSSLCDSLGISRSTWARYCSDPAYCDTTTHARGRFQNYLEQENLERDDKHLKGVQFDLTNNYGYKQKLDISSETIEEFLSAAVESGEDQSF